MTAGTVGPKELSDAKAGKKLLAIGYTHIDSVWQWDVHETEQSVLESWASTVDRMEAHPDLIYAATASAHYRMVEEQDPVLFAKIKRLVAENRWELCGGTVVEADCNLPSGESMARQYLYGQRYFWDRFDRLALADMEADGFGHLLGKGQIAKLGGAGKIYVCLRPQDHEAPGLPRMFWWEDNGGRRILVLRLTPEYGAGPNLLPGHLAANNRALETSNLPALLFTFFVGNHGGEPTEELLDKFAQFQQTNQFPLSYSRLDDFAAFAETFDLPVIKGDVLQHHARGCYATQADMKQRLRSTDHMLRTAEKMLALAAMSGAPYARELADKYYSLLGQAWEAYLFNQFHDLAAGTALKSGHDQAEEQFGSVRTVARKAIREAVQKVSWNISNQQDSNVMPVTVFNPHPDPLTGPIEADFNFDETRWPDAKLFDPDGREVPCQKVTPVYGKTGHSRIVFEPDMPGLGWTTFSWTKNVRGRKRKPAAIKATATRIRTPLVDLRIDPRTGWIQQLSSPRLGHRMLRGPAAVPIVIEDWTDTWGHGLVSYDGARSFFGPAEVQLYENGPVRAVIRAVVHYDCHCADTQRHGCTRLIQDYVVYKRSGIVEVRMRLFWTQQAKALKLQFPYSLRNAQVIAEASYANVRDRLPTGEEEPCQSYVAVHGTRRDGSSGGFAIVTDWAHSYSATPSALEFTALRSPVYSHHDPGKLDQDHLGEQLWTDRGEHEFTYRIVPFNGPWQDARLAQAAAELNEPLLYLNGTFRPEATLPRAMSLAALESSSVVMTALKRHEDDQGWIVRLWNSGDEAEASFTFAGRTFSASFTTEEIKTFLIPDDPEADVRETDILEF